MDSSVLVLGALIGIGIILAVVVWSRFRRRPKTGAGVYVEKPGTLDQAQSKQQKDAKAAEPDRSGRGGSTPLPPQQAAPRRPIVTPVVPPPAASPSPIAPPAPATPPPDDPLGGVDPMAWLESLARQQGTTTEDLITERKPEPPKPPPPKPSVTPKEEAPPIVVDEEGGLSNDPEALKQWLAAQAASLQRTRETAEMEAVNASPEPIPAAPTEIPDWLKESVERLPEPAPVAGIDIPDWLIDPKRDDDAATFSLDDLLESEPEGDQSPKPISAGRDIAPQPTPPVAPSEGEVTGGVRDTARKVVNRLVGRPRPMGDEEAEPPAQPHPVESPRRREVPKMAGEPEPQPTSEVNFTAFYPRHAQAEHRYGLYVYAHLPDVMSAIQKDAEKFVEELGGSVPSPRTAKQSARVADRTPITITPECEGLEFDPPSLSKRWSAPHVRYEFDFTPNAALVGDEAQGRISVAIAGIEVAHLKFSIEVSAASSASVPSPSAATLGFMPQSVAPPSATFADAVALPNNPLAAAKLTHTAPTKIYNRIFVSYSRQDQVVAEAYRLAQLAIGNEVFMDTYSIRVGEDWRVALAKAIDGADIFQLFWSENAAASENVRHEWDYALNFRCPDTRCAEFIRPVFWKTPIPVEPPSALSHLNFRYVPLSRYVSHATLDDAGSRPST